MAIINAGLLSDTVCLGREKSFVDVFNGSLKLVPDRPENDVIKRIEELIDNCNDALISELNSYSLVQIENLAINLIYLIEKLNIDSPLQVNISEVWKGIIGICFATVLNIFQQDMAKTLLAFSIGVCALPVLSTAYTYMKKWKRTGITQSGSTRLGQKITDLIIPILQNKRKKEYQQSVKAVLERGVQLAAIDKLFTTITLIRKPEKEDIFLYRKVISFIKEKQTENYYTFLHGQSLKIAMISKFLTKLLEKIEPTRDLTDFQCVRFVSKKHFDNCGFQEKNARSFLKSNCYIISDFFSYYKEIVSVTVNPFDNTPTETAFSYWMLNASVNKEVFEIVIDMIKKTINISEESCVAIQKTFEKIYEVLYRTKSVRSGNLKAICVPKNMFKHPETCIGYRAFPWGTPRDPLMPEKITNYLEKNWVSSASCQARLLTAQLVPENGVKIYDFNTLSTSETEECDLLLKGAVRALCIT